MVTAAPMVSLLSATSNESSSGTCVPHIITLDCSSPVLRASPQWAVTITTLEIYLEKLCKTSSGTCITLENLGNNILMIYIFKVKEYLGEMSGTILLLPNFVLQTLQI
jgi:hypothetical protein